MSRPPALLVGGNPQTISVGRRLAAMGVDVYGLGTGRELRYSRAFKEVYWPEGHDKGDQERAWTEWLLGEPGARFAGAVLLACDDVALTLIARNREKLAERFKLDISDPVAQLDMLNKHTTYEIATKADVPTPRYWMVRSLDEVIARQDEFVYPLLLKPVHSHEYQAKFPGKFRSARSGAELVELYQAMGHAGIECMLVETIEGPDSQLCSYFTYIEESGEPAFHFTKRVIRRFPPRQGFGCYHVTDVIPEVQEVGLRLVRAAGVRGLANVEFKRDARDGRLKLMECNARFVGSNALVASAGIDLAQMVYRRVLGEPVTWPTTFRSGLRQWHPVNDFRAMLALRRTGELTFGEWLRSVAHPRQTFAYFRLTDPGPVAYRVLGRAGRVLTGRVRRVAG